MMVYLKKKRINDGLSNSGKKELKEKVLVS